MIRLLIVSTLIVFISCACEHTCASCDECTNAISLASPFEEVCATLNLNQTIGNECVDLTGANNITFDCQGHEITTVAGIPHGIFISNVGSDTGDLVINGCVFRNTGAEFFGIKNEDTIKGLNITNCEFHGLDDGIRVENFDSVTVKNCVFTDYKIGVYIQGLYMILTQNEFYDAKPPYDSSSGYGIRLVNGNAYVAGNILRNGSCGLRMNNNRATPEGNLIENNSFDDFVTAVNLFSYDFLFQNNRIGPGIVGQPNLFQIGGWNDGIARNNEVQGGLYITTDNVDIIGNNITSGKFREHGIYCIGSVGMRFIDNLIHDCYGIGIYFDHQNCGNNEIRDNVFCRNGVDVESAHAPTNYGSDNQCDFVYGFNDDTMGPNQCRWASPCAAEWPANSCSCTSCDDCTSKMQDLNDCGTITLLNDISRDTLGASCLAPDQFTHKTLDCNGYTVNAVDNSDDFYSLAMFLGSTSIIQNCVFTGSPVYIHAGHMTVDNISILDPGRYSTINARYSSITNSLFTGNAVDFGSQVFQGSAYTVITNNKFYEIHETFQYSFIVALESTCCNNVFSNNEIVNCSSTWFGVNIHYHDWTVEDNIFRNIGGVALYVSSGGTSQQTNIRRNIFENVVGSSSYGVVRFSDVRNTLFEDNTMIESNSGDCIVIKCTNWCRNLQILHNEISCLQHGIFIDESIKDHGITIAYNNMSSSAYDVYNLADPTPTYPIGGGTTIHAEEHCDIPTQVPRKDVRFS